MAKKRTEEEKEYHVLLSNIREVIKLKQGKELIWHLLEISGIYTVTFTGNAQSYFNEGRRSLGLQILELLEEADPTFYPRLLLEKQKNKRLDDDDDRTDNN